jgi:2-oxoglutarate dehydrogenase E2 component (dihydrolipoamide succinyltransferase)
MADRVDVVTPPDQEGTEAVVLRWFKHVGDAVTEHEPLLELETDKVTVEIPAPASGQLLEILKGEKESVEPGTVLARIARGTARAAEAPKTVTTAAPPKSRVDEGLLSPAVRRLLSEHNLDAADIAGSGKGGRVTAQDVERHLARMRAPAPSGESVPDSGPTAASRHVPHSPIRKRIAAHMVHSVATAPHVTTLFEADMSRVVAHRQQHAREFEARGAKLTYTAYFVAAAVKALRTVPEVNASFHDESLEIFSDCNVGVGTALGNEGLIVPVIHRAQTLDLFGTARRLGELVAAARVGKLSTDDVRGGTFTISNHGVSGSLLAAPIIINQPQVAILGVGKLERRVVVREVGGVESLSVRPMCYVTLTIDHRALDAFQANAFLTALVSALQGW